MFDILLKVFTGVIELLAIGKTFLMKSLWVRLLNLDRLGRMNRPGLNIWDILSESCLE